MYKRLLIEKVSGRERARGSDSVCAQERELEKYENGGIGGGSDPLQISSYRRSSSGASEGQFKIELEKKIIECNSFMTRLQEKDKKVAELEAKNRDLQADF